MTTAERLLSECHTFRSTEYWIEAIDGEKWLLQIRCIKGWNPWDYLREDNGMGKVMEFDTTADALAAFDKWKKGEKA